MTPLKVCTIHNHYQQPGGEKAAVEAQVALLREHGHSVITYLRDNTEIESYGLTQKASFFLNTVFSKRTYQEIQAIVVNEHPDVAHIHNAFPLISPSVYRAFKKAGVPIVQTVHNFRFLCPNALFYTHGQTCERCKYGNTLHAIRFKCYHDSRVLSALYALSIGLHRRWGTFGVIDRFIALTEFSAQKLLESGLTTVDKITVLGNFLPEPLPAPGSFENREPYVVYLGRLSPEKGVDVLLDALADFPDLGLKIAGDGPQAEILRIKARQRGTDRVQFLGYVAGERKWELLRHAMATVVPSVWYENFPVTVLESLAVGTPVVASNFGSLPSIVAGGKSGQLFRPGDSWDLRKKLAWLAKQPVEALQMGRYGRHNVEIKYSADVHYRTLITLYAQFRDGVV
jgi:glycosyltransferase involved in cell wall biosynthesis